MNAVSISDLPRNRAQAKYARRGHTRVRSFDKIDSLAIMLEQCKRQQMNRKEQPFIREITGAPELRCVLAYDWQLDDLATFCMDPEEMSVFGADPIFNLGRFNASHVISESQSSRQSKWPPSSNDWTDPAESNKNV